MKQKKINYADIIALGFKEELTYDSVFEKIHGYPFVIISKKLTKNVYLEWRQDTRKCNGFAIDNKRKGNILYEFKVKNLKHLKKLLK